MTNKHEQTQSCPIGERTLRAMIKAGYAPLAVGLVALREKGILPHEVFSRSQLIDCGLGVDIVKTIMNQCEGREFDKRKAQQRSTTRTKNLSAEQKQRLEEIIRTLSTQDSPSQNLHLIKTNLQLDKAGRIYFIERDEYEISNFQPPQPEAVKALFSTYQYAGELKALDLAPFRAKRGRGRPSRLYVFPLEDDLAKLFSVQLPDHNQKHYPIWGYKTTEGLVDGLFLEWMKDHISGPDNKHRLADLCSIPSDSVKTLGKRLKRVEITSHRNYFLNKVTPLEIEGLLINCRPGCWFQLEAPTSQAYINLPKRQQMEKRINTKHYHVTSVGMAGVRKEWLDTFQSYGKFEDCLRLGGFDISSYELPE